MPSAEEMAKAGFTPADYETDDFEVWPENWPAFCLMFDLQTQWRTSMSGGVTGLDYNVLFHKMGRLDLPDEEYDQIESDVRIMEAAAMVLINTPP